VVLDVTGTPRVLLVLALELLEQDRRRLAEDIHQHVEPAPVGHADDYFLHAACAHVQHRLVQQGNQALAAFQGKPLLADVA
jgi:hypothetical protein